MTNKTDLVALRGALAKPNVSLADVYEAIAARKREQQAKPSVPAKVVGTIAAISDDTRRALRSLATHAESLELPTEARQMNDQERSDAITVFLEAQAAKTQAEKVLDAIKAAIHNHLDAEAIAAGRSADLDAHDHLALAGVFGAPDKDKVIRREERGGNAVPTSVADLRQMEADGVITHKEFLNLTVPQETRSIDPLAVMRRMTTDETFAKAVYDRTQLSPKSTALNVRKA